MTAGVHSIERLYALYYISLFFFIGMATTEIYTLSLHDALPILRPLLIIGSSLNQEFSSGRPGPALSNRRGTAYDFGNFLGNRCLTRLVVDQLQLVNNGAGVVGGALHSDHSCRMLGSDVLDQPLIDQGFDKPRQQCVQQRLGVGLIQIIPL